MKEGSFSFGAEPVKYLMMEEAAFLPAGHTLHDGAGSSHDITSGKKPRDIAGHGFRVHGQGSQKETSSAGHPPPGRDREGVCPMAMITVSASRGNSLPSPS